MISSPCGSRCGSGVTGLGRPYYPRLGRSFVTGFMALQRETAHADQARAARHRARIADGRGDDDRRLCADPLPRRPPRLGHLPAAGDAGGLAPRADPGAGGRGRGRAVVRLLLLFAVLRLLPGAAGRDPQSRAVHGRRRGDQPSRQPRQAADRAGAQARERDERSLRLLAAARGGAVGRRNLSRDRGICRQPRAAQCRAVRRRQHRRPSGQSGGARRDARRRSPRFSAARSRRRRSRTTTATPGSCAASRSARPISA